MSTARVAADLGRMQALLGEIRGLMRPRAPGPAPAPARESRADGLGLLALVLIVAGAAAVYWAIRKA